MCVTRHLDEHISEERNIKYTGCLHFFDLWKVWRIRISSIFDVFNLMKIDFFTKLRWKICFFKAIYLMVLLATIIILKNEYKWQNIYTGWLKNMSTIYSKVYNYRYKVFSKLFKVFSYSILVERNFLSLADTSMNIFLKTEV